MQKEMILHKQVTKAFIEEFDQDATENNFHFHIAYSLPSASIQKVFLIELTVI